MGTACSHPRNNEIVIEVLIKSSGEAVYMEISQ